jgi:hypothetical protein
MKVVKQGLAVSDEDLRYISKDVITEMMKHRLVVEFDETPELENLDFSGCRGFYFIKSLGNKLYQFWFEDESDYNAFYENILAYKLSITTSDK